VKMIPADHVGGKAYHLRMGKKRRRFPGPWEWWGIQRIPTENGYDTLLANQPLPGCVDFFCIRLEQVAPLGRPANLHPQGGYGDPQGEPRMRVGAIRRTR